MKYGKLFLSITLMLVIVYSGFSVVSSSNDNDYMQLPADIDENLLPSTEEMFSWIVDLWDIGQQGEYGYRMPGTAANQAGAEYILQKLQEFGITDSYIEENPAYLSFPEVWSLTVKPEGLDAEEIPCYFLRYSAFTPAEGIDAEMVYLGTGSPAAFAEVDDAVGIEGKIVVVDVLGLKLPFAGSFYEDECLFWFDPEDTTADDNIFENWPPINLESSYQLAGNYGAAGYVGILTFTVDSNNQFLHWYADGSIPGVTVSPVDGEHLRTLLGSGTVEATITLTGSEMDGVTNNVYGFLPGATEEVIIIRTHHDGWATNEGSGAAVVMALAKYFAQLPENERARTLLFDFYGSHFGKADHWTQYDSTLLELQDEIVATLIAEMIAKQYQIVGGSYVETGRSSLAGIQLNRQLLFSIVGKAMVLHNLERTGITTRFSGEGQYFGPLGIPTIERIAHNAPQFTQDDTPETVMIEQLKPTVSAFIEMIERLDTVPKALIDDPVSPVRAFFTINNGAQVTGDIKVNLELYATSDEFHNYDPLENVDNLQMRLSNDGESWSDWEPYGTTLEWTLANPDSNGIKTVYLQVKDSAENIAEDRESIILKIEEPGVDRIFGQDRYLTAVEISKNGWPDGASTVLLARGDNFPDSLAGVPLAYQLDAPILLTPTGALIESTVTEIERLAPERVIILGGPAAVSAEVEAALAEVAPLATVDRIGGEDRYETAALIAEELVGGESVQTAFIAFGLNFPDTLAAASYAAVEGYPILLTATGTIPGHTVDALENLGVEDTVVVGGEAVIGKEVFDALPNAVRVAGADRYATALALADNYLPEEAKHVYVATGVNFPDALAGGVLAANHDSGILLVQGKLDEPPAAVQAFFESRSFSRVIIFGGPAAVSEGIEEWLLENLLQ